MRIDVDISQHQQPWDQLVERARFAEGVDVIMALMTEEHATSDGRYYRLRDATYRPLPVQRPHPPLWIGGGGEKRLLPLAAGKADVWHGFGSVPELARKSQLLDRMARDAGRDPSTLRRSTSLSLSEPWDEVRKTADDLRAAFPAAPGYVHELGARHLADPTRLIDSAGRVYGDLLDSLYGRLSPTPAARIRALDDGETVGSLTAVHSPGHAKHHLAVH